MNKKQNIAGYTLVELMLAVVVGSIVLAGTYASFTTVSIQSQKSEGASFIHSNAVPTIKILSRDIRMAGYKAVDTNIESTIGIISQPLLITDSVNACCDRLQIIFDKDSTTRKRYTYFVSASTNPTRNALLMNIENWSGSSWVIERSNEVIADYIEDFQITGSDNNSDGFPTLLDISLVFREKTPSRFSYAFSKPLYSTGNYNYNFTDNYLRVEFSTTILLRNLLQKSF